MGLFLVKMASRGGREDVAPLADWIMAGLFKEGLLSLQPLLSLRSTIVTHCVCCDKRESSASHGLVPMTEEFLVFLVGVSEETRGIGIGCRDLYKYGVGT